MQRDLAPAGLCLALVFIFSIYALAVPRCLPRPMKKQAILSRLARLMRLLRTCLNVNIELLCHGAHVAACASLLLVAPASISETLVYLMGTNALFAMLPLRARLAWPSIFPRGRSPTSRRGARRSGYGTRPPTRPIYEGENGTASARPRVSRRGESFDQLHPAQSVCSTSTGRFCIRGRECSGTSRSGAQRLTFLQNDAEKIERSCCHNGLNVGVE